MKKKIAILGSTGSIGKTLLKIIKKKKNFFDVVLLTANKDSKTLIKQAKKFNARNLIITNKKSFEFIKNRKSTKFKVFNSLKNIDNILKKKIDYVMSSIVGIDGLDPTIRIIKYTKKIAIANKESIICGWGLIEKELKKNKVEFIPVDSEHFSAWYGLKNNNDHIEKLYLTASGGPFINYPLKKFNRINIKQALKHPNWKMGKKITIDSATMMNKVFEIIEAKNIFDINYKNLEIITHPHSYIHSIIKFKNGLIKIIAHDTNMKIPIFNTIFNNPIKNNIKTSKVDFQKLNNLNFKKVNIEKFPLVKILNMLPKKNSLFETIIVSSNDELVNAFLEKKIKFNDISKLMINFINRNEFKKFKLVKPNKIQQILELNKYVRLKINLKSI